jgi:hypothetical protein
MDTYQPIRELIDRVRARWRWLRLFRSTVRGAVGASAVLAAGLVAAHWADRSPVALIVIAGMSVATAAAVFAWALAAVLEVPSDRRVARFIEEHAPALDDRLVTAVDFVESGKARTAPAGQMVTGQTPAGQILAGYLIADAASRARHVDLDAVFPAARLKRSGWGAAGATLVLLLIAFFWGGPARQSLDAASWLVFPSRTQLSVRPGDARLIAGSPLAIEAQLVGSRAPVNVQLEINDGAQLRTIDMASAEAGAFRLALDTVSVPFRYRVIAGTVTSPTYAISVAKPPRVTRVDLEYTYPASLGLKPRSEQDSGDIYAPAGTEVLVRIHADLPAVTGRLAVAGGTAVPLAREAPTVMSGTLRVAADASYRITLADRDGLSSEGATEYFIRVLDDRLPEVHVTRPASDRAVTRLEEVDIEAAADDDHGVERFELVYAVRGGAERAIALDVPPHATSVTARRTLFLEDLDIQPGDFISYYVRAWDRTGGTRPREARSDIFFLDVKPYEQEFALAQSQSMSGSGYSGALDELVNRQRQVVVATWKLNRRAESAQGAQSDRDIRSVAGTESDLKLLVEQTSSTFRESSMRDPRRREPGASSGQLRPEEDAMAAGAAAMGRAVTALEGLKTADALPPEMEALNHLLKAQADIKRRQLSVNQSAAGAGNANRNYDISTLFDRELQRQQQTSYETPKGVERPPSDTASLDRIKDLARRQDELLRRQQELARVPVAPEERRRELEKLTREQSELRQDAEELARQASQRQPRAGQPSDARNGSRRDADLNGQTSGNGGNDVAGKQLRDVSEQMRQAASDLRRGAPEQAGASGGRALEKLRDLERRLQSGQPDDRGREPGEMRLEARQLADGQRQLASALGKLPSGDAGRDALRRLAADQGRLADRMRRLQDDVRQQTATAPRGTAGDQGREAAWWDVTRDSAALSDRMQRAADELNRTPTASRPPAASTAQELARQLDQLADRLAGATGDQDGNTRKLSEQLARTEEARDKLQQIGQALEKAGRENGRAGGNSAQKTAGESGRTGEGRQGAGGTDLTKLREESLRQLQDAQRLLEELRRQDPGASRNGAGFTFEGQGMVMSAPGTEAFKQDFEKWDLLKRQAMVALEEAGSAVAKKVQTAAAKDRLAAGVEDTAPADYRSQVDTYFKSLAGRK